MAGLDMTRVLEFGALRILLQRDLQKQQVGLKDQLGGGLSQDSVGSLSPTQGA